MVNGPLSLSDRLRRHQFSNWLAWRSTLFRAVATAASSLASAALSGKKLSRRVATDCSGSEMRTPPSPLVVKMIGTKSRFINVGPPAL